MNVRALGFRSTILIALAAHCLAFAPTPAAAEHLWAAYIGPSSQGYPFIARYALVNGIPASQPDLTIAGMTDPMTVTSDGTLYATVPLDCCFGLGQINAYPPNSTQPSRTITLTAYPSTDTTIDNALAVDADGRLYVGFQAFISGMRGRFVPFSQSNAPYGIAIYPANANGGGPPKKVIPISGPNGPVALAFAPNGELYASGETTGYEGAVFHIADPAGKHKILDILDVYGLIPNGLAVSPNGRHFFLLTTAPDVGPSNIDVYPSDANGSQQPARRFGIAQYLGPSLALYRGAAYTQSYSSVFNTQGTIAAYSERAKGNPPPLFVNDLPGQVFCYQVAIGP